jgi:CRISPR-associated endonuclease/helicase Cas3
MCPVHRRLRLWQIRRALKAGKTCRVVSTQVVEAGVDVDFPVVYRALAGLDSIAQAAGRCNRNGRLGAMGQVFVFESEHPAMNRYFADTANCATQTMALHPDPLDLLANECFFRLYYWDKKPMWDAHHILDCFHLHQDAAFPFNFSFATAARSFNLIDDAASCSVIIPWGRHGRKLSQRLRDGVPPDRELLRRAQRFAVRVFRQDWMKHAGSDIHLIYDNLGILISPQAYYDAQTGLNFEAEGPGYYFG